MTVRALAGRSWRRVACTAELVRSPSGEVAYLGFAGRGNLGDDAILEAERTLLPELELHPIPKAPWLGSALAVAQRARSEPVFAGLLVGGGTLVGRFGWRPAVEAVVSRVPTAPAFAIGVGVEDPDYDEAGVLTDRTELQAWAALLRHFAHVSVRGPRSAELLREVGIDAEVVGDPALALAVVDPPAVEEGLLGLGIAIPETIWGGDHERVVDALTRAGRALANHGWRIEVQVMRPVDLAASQRIAHGIGNAARVVAPTNVHELLRLVARCDVVVAERLHAVVLAAATSTPALMVSYRPKCEDFLASIGRSDHGVRTDAVTAEHVVERVRALAADRHAHASAIGDAVGGLRRRLRSAADVVSERVAG